MRLLQKAISFAARAHRHQLRKDKETPYVAHPYRVALTVRHLFGVEDEPVLAAAVLHDTIEDTNTDRDDLVREFTPEVALWVSLLSKDKRLAEAEREAAYREQIAGAPWQVKLIKLADMYDNLSDSETMSPDRRRETFEKAQAMFPFVLKNLPPRHERAAKHVEAILAGRAPSAPACAPAPRARAHAARRRPSGRRRA